MLERVHSMLVCVPRVCGQNIACACLLREGPCVLCRETVDKGLWANISSRECVDVNYHMMVQNFGTCTIYTAKYSNHRCLEIRMR